MQIEADTLDDLLNRVFKKLLRAQHISPTKDPAREIRAVLLVLKNPRARFSRAESRATLFSCLGELCWYLAGRDDLAFIQYYIPRYYKYSDDGKTLNGAYGRRWFDLGDVNQIEKILDILKNKGDSRQAVMQVFSASDLQKKTEDVPCTCTLQFMKRNGKLEMLTNMRSNDAYLGLPHDIFSFTMLQEILARSANCELGRYYHSVGSLHLYDKDNDGARRYLSEGFQTTDPKMAMPPMPLGDPWPQISWLQEAEEKIRLGNLGEIEGSGIDPYWLDIARLLKIKALYMRKNLRDLVTEKNAMRSPVFNAFIRGKERQLAAAQPPAQPDLLVTAES